jgi:CheY-like chemotaxis protein
MTTSSDKSLWATKKVLVVDDEPDLRELVILELQEAGFQTLEAPNGKVAFEIVQKEQVDVVVTDVRMPGGGGVELLDEIKKRNPESPAVIMVTGFADLGVDEAFDRGAEALISKPYHYDALIELTKQILTPRDEKYTRKFKRFDAAVNIELTLPSFEETRITHTLNIGRGGMFIHMEQNLPVPGQKISFRVLFKDKKYSPIEGLALCRWNRHAPEPETPKGFGLEFVSLTNESQKNLANLLNDIKIRAFIPNR